MPTIAANDVELHYEISGPGPDAAAQARTGTPLLLITGLGFGIWSWYRQIPTFSRYLTTIAVDNRGIGGSSAPPGPFTIADMADDTAALLRGLAARGACEERVHVLGLSMGGFVAQELALRHPELVDRLILACTSAGLGFSVPASADTVATLMIESEAGWTDEILAKGAHLRFSDDFIRDHGDILADLGQRRRGKLPSREFWHRQIQAALGFSSGSRLGDIRSPNLILTGDDDPIVPPENSEILARHIPGARMLAFPRGRHLFHIESAERFNREVLAFLGHTPDNQPRPAN